MPENQSLTFKSNAKINLYLHVIGKRSNGYHDLDSLVCFTDFGDDIIISPSSCFEFEVSGDFAKSFSKQELKADRTSENIAVKAVWNICDKIGFKPDFKLHLKKNLPLAAGIGGGSSNAACAIRAVCEYKGIDINCPEITEIVTNLGADVLVCMDDSPKLIRGTGQEVSKKIDLVPLAMVLVKPEQGCSTAQVFKNFNAEHKNAMKLPECLANHDLLIDFLLSCDNDLCNAARKICKEIPNILEIIKKSGDPLIYRMSGSGSCCFGIYESIEQAQFHAKIIKENYPELWVVATFTLS